MSQSERILGIDPGTVVMGFGVVDRVGSQLKLVDLGSVKFQASKDSVQRLGDPAQLPGGRSAFFW